MYTVHELVYDNTMEAATSVRLTAVPTYPQTATFPYVFVVQEEDEDFLTAYGLRIASLGSDLKCEFCEEPGADAYVEVGATGAPAEGEPVHMRCVLEGGGVIARTEDVTFVDAP